MTPAGIKKPLHLLYIGGAVVVDKIISKTNHLQISFYFPASYFLLSCILHAAGNSERCGYCGKGMMIAVFDGAKVDPLEDKSHLYVVYGMLTL